MAQRLLDVQNLRTHFFTRSGVVKAVEDVSFYLDEGETLGIVGESGSGKSVTSLTVMRLIVPPGKIVGGKILFQDEDILEMDEDDLYNLRGGKIAMIFQDPMTSLNPVYTVGFQITEAIRAHLKLDRAAAEKRAVEMMDRVRIPEARGRMNDYPHQFSGGMRQRAMIAMALSCNPQLLIADEPTTALDVTIQAQIVELVRRLRDKIGMAIIWISHDLGVVAGLADNVQVMYAGTIVERGPVSETVTDTRHPYALRLKGALPRVDRRSEGLVSIEGTAPDMRHPPVGCPFAARCAFRIERCLTEKPPLLPVIDGHPEHLAACF